jgi:predicted lipoprotein with Yx(FWY)xxD motif
MNRIRIFLATLLASASGAAAIADAHAGSNPAQAAKVAKVQLRKTKLGRILVDSSGFTLYRFMIDPRNKDRCVMVSECPGVWPPLTTSGRPIAGPGVNTSLLSTIRLPNGKKQVTYAGHPLYGYSPATERGETAYIGTVQFGGAWDALNASGRAVK